MALDSARNEQERQEYEYRYALDKANELEKYKKAVDMCIAAGFLRQDKWNEAIRFVTDFHKG